MSPAEWQLHEQDGQLPQYVLKREFAEGAIYMTMLQYPADALLAAHDGLETLYRCDSEISCVLKPLDFTSTLSAVEPSSAMKPCYKHHSLLCPATSQAFCMEL